MDDEKRKAGAIADIKLQEMMAPAIADKWGFGRSTVRGWAAELGIKLPTKQITYTEEDFIEIDKYFTTMTNKAIARMFPDGPGESAIRGRRIKLGIPNIENYRVRGRNDLIKGYSSFQIQEMWKANREIEDLMYTWKRSKELRGFVNEYSKQRTIFA